MKDVKWMNIKCIIYKLNEVGNDDLLNYAYNIKFTVCVSWFVNFKIYSYLFLL